MTIGWSFPINHFSYLHSQHYYSMPSSSRTIPGTQNQFGISRATVQVRGQTGNCTNTGRAITPFMFNKEGYRVSVNSRFLSRELIVAIVCS